MVYGSPVNPEALLELLKSATSHDTNVLQNASNSLKALETSPNFFSSLQEIAYNRNVDFLTRFQSLTYLKNCIDVSWRKTAFNKVPDEEKELIRSRIFSLLEEDNKQLGIVNIILISKIARHDYPKEWPNLFDIIINLLNNINFDNNNTFYVQIFRTLYYTVKALSTKALPKDKKRFIAITIPLATELCPRYQFHYNRLKGYFQAQNDGETLRKLVTSELEPLFLLLKTMRRLISVGSNDFNQHPQLKAFFSDTVEHFKEIYQLVKNLANTPLQDAFIKYLYLLGKIYIDLQYNQPLPLVAAESWLPLFQTYWLVLEEMVDEEKLIKICIQAMILIKNTVSNYSYMIEKGDEPSEDLLLVRRKIDHEFLSEANLVKLIEVTITKYMVLKPNTDLNMFEHDPEIWISEDEADHWEFNIRKCAEKLLSSIIFRYKKWVGPHLLNILKQFIDPKESLNDILIKDAIYNAIGTSSHDLFDVMDFDQWFQAHLANEMIQEGTYSVLLKARISWLIGQWINVKSLKEHRPTYYHALLYVMTQNHEQSITLIPRWMAANALQKCIDDWDFDIDSFLPYLEGSIDQLIALLITCQELENKMKIMKILATIVERMESKITPYAAKIANLLPPLWQAAGSEENLLKASIVVTLTSLVKSLGRESAAISSFTCPVIGHSVNLDDEAHVYLLTDSLILWQEVVRHADTLTPELLALVPNAIRLLDSASDELPNVFKILNTYMVLAGDAVLNAFGQQLMLNLYICITSLRSEAVKHIMSLLEIMILSANPNNYQNLLVESGLFKLLIAAPIERKEGSYVQNFYYTVLSRLAIKDPSFFMVAFSQIDPSNTVNLVFELMDYWTEKIDSMPNLKSQKLACLAWAYLIATPIPNVEFYPAMDAIYRSLPKFATGWTALLSEVSESEEGDTLAYHHEVDTDGEDVAQDDAAQSVDFHRRRELVDIDPAHSIPLLPSIHTKLNDAMQIYDNVQIATNNPQASFQMLIDSIDTILLEQLKLRSV